jgi:signal recognition particle GTPase
MAAMREHLIGKNVATEIADRLCESVLANMVGKKPGTFKSTSWTDSVRLCVCLYVYLLERERERDAWAYADRHSQGSAPGPMSSR